MKPLRVIPEKVRGYKVSETVQEYTEYHAILYAIGIGISTDPLCKKDLDFTYELSDNFKIFPTFGSTFGDFYSMIEAFSNCPGIPEFNSMELLHGEHKFELIKPLAKNQKLFLKQVVTDIADKVKGALATIVITAHDQSGNLLFRNTKKIYFKGLGGFGDKGLSNEKPIAVPKTAPTKVSVFTTLPSQAFIYRLVGDYNPHNVSPEMAALGGLDKPILQGLCYFGIAARSILKDYCQDDVRKFKSFSTRFTSHVFPGETLITETWQTPNGVIFQQKTKERGKVCCVGFLELDLSTPKL